MISIAIIVFRETMEISVILGLLLLATKTVENRNRWIQVGLGAGVLGSLAVAFFAEKISGAFEGSGQEIMNAAVLFLAGLLIAWTIVWMNRHGRLLAEKMKRTGQEITQGLKPVHTLAFIAALTMLREGSEIVLFTYGFLIAGETPLLALWGALLGLFSGAGLGAAIYFGFGRISQKVVFRTTNIFLVLLAAGMIAQGFSFLNAAGVVPSMGEAWWDSSSFIPDQHWFGQVLSALIGYTSQPSGIQVLAYFFTVAIITLIMNGKKFMTFRGSVKGSAIALVFIFMAQSEPAHAYKVYSPNFNQREIELEARMKAKEAGDQNYKFAVGAGLFSFWFTELYGEFEKAPGGPLEFEALEWENRFMFFEPGENFIDVGLYLAYEHKFIENGVNKAEVKLLFEKETGRFTHLLNLVAVLPFSSPFSPEYQSNFGTRLRLVQAFEPGMEVYANFGDFSDGNNIDVLIGPVLKGKFFNFKYDVGYLFSTYQAPSENAFKINLEYEIYF